MRSMVSACWDKDMNLSSDSLSSIASVRLGTGWLGYVRIVEVVGMKYLSMLAERHTCLLLLYLSSVMGLIFSCFSSFSWACRASLTVLTRLLGTVRTMRDSMDFSIYDF